MITAKLAKPPIAVVEEQEVYHIKFLPNYFTKERSCASLSNCDPRPSLSTIQVKQDDWAHEALKMIFPSFIMGSRAVTRDLGASEVSDESDGAGSCHSSADEGVNAWSSSGKESEILRGSKVSGISGEPPWGLFFVLTHRRSPGKPMSIRSSTS